MEYYKISITVIVVITLLLYINLSKKYDNFIISENSLVKIENKIYYLKRNHNKKLKILNLFKKMLKFDNNIYNNILNLFKNNYNNNLIFFNKEIENIKNLNKIYQNKIYNLDDINKLYIIKNDYKKKLNKIRDTGYDKIINLELDNLNLYKYYYIFYKDMSKNYLNIVNITDNCINDIYNIFNDFNDKLYKNKNKSILKIKKNNCNIHISWYDSKYNIKCCNIK